jgi:lipoprotein-releasing system permease protein
MSAMGFTRLGIAKIFFYEGLIVGALGAVLGIILGLSISFALQYFDVFKLPSGIYYVERLPIAVAPLDVVLVSLCSFIVSALAGIYPAYQVSKLNPVEAIKG